VAGKIQRRFTKGKLCLTNLTACYDETSCSEDERRVMDAVYLDFIKAFDVFFPSIPVDKLIRYNLDRQTMKSGSPAKIKG